MTTDVPLWQELTNLGACRAQIEWSRPFGNDYVAAWQQCQNSGWLLGYLGSQVNTERFNLCRRKLIQCSLDVAETGHEFWAPEDTTLILRMLNAMREGIKDDTYQDRREIKKSSSYFRSLTTTWRVLVYNYFAAWKGLPLRHRGENVDLRNNVLNIRRLMEESPDVFYANYDAYVDSYIVYSCMKYATRLCMLKRTVDGYQSYLMMCAFKSGSFASTVNYDQFGIKRRLSVRPERFNDYRRNASFIVKQRFPTPLGY